MCVCVCGGGGGVKKMEIPERWWGLTEVPSMVGVWIFSGTTHYMHTNGFFLYCLKNMEYSTDFFNL